VLTFSDEALERLAETERAEAERRAAQFRAGLPALRYAPQPQRDRRRRLFCATGATTRAAVRPLGAQRRRCVQ
jgi:hypothetical protein